MHAKQSVANAKQIITIMFTEIEIQRELFYSIILQNTDALLATPVMLTYNIKFIYFNTTTLKLILLYFSITINYTIQREEFKSVIR